MSKKLPTFNLPAADSLFSTQEERDTQQRERVIDLPLSEIHDFSNHPFKVKMDNDMMEMVESVKQYGVLVPGLVRPRESGGYEMVAGHRRKMASELAECATMPCIIRDLSDDEAIIIMVDSNLQRERILLSEKAHAYKMKLDAMKRQGQRTDLSSNPSGRKLLGVESAALVGESTGDSQVQVRRYIRLTELTSPLLDMVDDGRLNMRSAVELSYVPQEQQELLRNVIEAEKRTPSHVQAVKMRKLSDEGHLTSDAAASIMQEDNKPAKPEQFKMPREKIQRFFPADAPVQTIEATIIQALELWHKNK